MLNVIVLIVIMLTAIMLLVVTLKVIVMNVISCKIFEHFALLVDPAIGFTQTGFTPFKDSSILAPKLAESPF